MTSFTWRNPLPATTLLQSCELFQHPCKILFLLLSIQTQLAPTWMLPHILANLLAILLAYVLFLLQRNDQRMSWMCPFQSHTLQKCRSCVQLSNHSPNASANGRYLQSWEPSKLQWQNRSPHCSMCNDRFCLLWICNNCNCILICCHYHENPTQIWNRPYPSCW